MQKTEVSDFESRVDRAVEETQMQHFAGLRKVFLMTQVALY